QAAASGSSASEDVRGALRELVEILIQIIGPFMTQLAEECCAQIGGAGLVSAAPWPEFDARLVVDDEVVLPVQINGKKRGDLTIARDADQATIEQAVLALDFVKNALNGASPRKI